MKPQIYLIDKMATPENFYQTSDVNAAIVLVQTVQEQTDCRMGAIMGAPGSGKTEISRFLQQRLNAIRLCAYTNMGKRKLVQDLATALDHPNPTAGTFDSVLSWIEDHIEPNTLILIDEADCLSWKHLETFRWLADEGGASVILFGTEILERTFADPRSGAYLKRLSRRIGTKRHTIRPFSQDEISLYVLQPRFAQVTQTAAKLFHKSCEGLIGEAVELARACKDLADRRQESKLTEAIVREALDLRK